MTRPSSKVRLGHGPVVVELAPGGVRARTATRRERVASHVFGERLDRQLAAGAAPEGSPELSLRARQLACPASRRMLATTLVRLLRSADEPLSSFGPPRSRVALDRVSAARPQLEALVQHLIAPVPVSARGVALVRLLVSDGTGPLYRGESHSDLDALLAAATRALQPTEDWPGLTG